MQGIINLDQIKLTNKEISRLKKLIQISYQGAKDAVYEILGTHCILQLDEIKFINSELFKSYLVDKIDYDKDISYITTQLFVGRFSGETVLFLDNNSASNLAKSFTLNDNNSDEINLRDIVLEISNILTSSMICKFTQELSTTISFTPPVLQQKESLQAINEQLFNNFDQFMVISTKLIFKKQNIEGEILLITKKSSLGWLRDSLYQYSQSGGIL